MTSDSDPPLPPSTSATLHEATPPETPPPETPPPQRTLPSDNSERSDNPELSEAPQSSTPTEVPDEDVPLKQLLAEARTVFGGWPLQRRVVVAAATLFTLFHIGAALLRGAPKRIREPLWPLAGWYSDGFRMTDTWGMFSLPPKDKLVSVVGITVDGQRRELSHVLQNERDFKQRIIDTRLRKIQTKLASEKTRNHWGRGYVNYYCKKALAEGIPLRRVQVEVLGKKDEKPEIFLVQSCRAPRQKAPGVR